jgi:hypothetical protein
VPERIETRFSGYLDSVWESEVHPVEIDNKRSYVRALLGLVRQFADDKLPRIEDMTEAELTAVERLFQQLPGKFYFDLSQRKVEFEFSGHKFGDHPMARSPHLFQ